MADGRVTVPPEGTPQGGPGSPFLSNLGVAEVDKEVERRGQLLVRYAEDATLYGKRQRAGSRGMERVSRFLTQRLKLGGKQGKSAVAKPQNRKSLGFTCTGGTAPNRRKIAPESVARVKAKGRGLTRRTGSSSLADRSQRLSRYRVGWREYFGYWETPPVLRDLDNWSRRQRRGVQWKQGQGYNRRKAARIRRGVNEELAATTAWRATGPWRACQTPGVPRALNTADCDALGLPRLEPRPTVYLYRTAVVRTRMPGGVGGGKS